MSPRASEPRPICPECGEVVDPKKARILSRLRGDERWISAPELLMGVYCQSDHLLDAYLRGYPGAAIRSPRSRRR